MTESTSPLALPFPAAPAIDGVALHVARAAYKNWDRCDLTFVTLEPGTVVAGVLTQSKCPSPEVEWCRAALTLGQARALVVNAGNSNAFTGSRGRAAVEAIAARTAAYLGCQPSDVFVASTGVIGVPLPIDKAEAGLDAAFVAAPCGWEDAAATIMTTDTFTKGAVTTAVIGDRTVTLVGIIKGSGMIAPDMATMLGFIFTDAAVEPCRERCRRRTRRASRASPSTATPRPATRCWRLQRARLGTWRWPMTTASARMHFARHWRICATSSLCWSSATAKARRS